PTPCLQPTSSCRRRAWRPFRPCPSLPGRTRARRAGVPRGTATAHVSYRPPHTDRTYEISGLIVPRRGAIGEADSTPGLGEGQAVHQGHEPGLGAEGIEHRLD